MSNVYFVGLIKVRDAAIWQTYLAEVGETITQYGGVVLFRGAFEKSLSGNTAHEYVVTLQFTNTTDALRWHDSPEYQRLIPIRDAGADVTLTLYR
jgi:uncharacterized protein (DUF1330 family)